MMKERRALDTCYFREVVVADETDIIIIAIIFAIGSFPNVYDLRPLRELHDQSMTIQSVRYNQ